MPIFIEFCAMDYEKKIFEVAHVKNAKKTVSRATTPTSVDELF